MTPRRRRTFQLILREDVTENRSERILKFLVSLLNRHGKTQDCLEERMQNTNKVWWRDVKAKTCRGGVKCKRMVEMSQRLLLRKRKLVLESWTLDRVTGGRQWR